MCLNPIYSQLCEWTDVFGERKRKLIFSNFDLKKDLIPLACGSCFECQKQKAREWSYRLMNECSYYEKNIFITLTYRNAPEEINKRDLQLFIKRLRRRLEPKKIRFFACGEYGSKGHRPHYHVIVFGWCPDDFKFFCLSKKKQKMYRSKFLEEVWTDGFVDIEYCSENTCKYIANYMQKLNQVEGKRKPFLLMSTKPGIGYKYAIDHPEMLETDKIYLNGRNIKVPRYYQDVLLRHNPFLKPKIDENLKVREQRALLYDIGFENLKKKKERILSKFL